MLIINVSRGYPTIGFKLSETNLCASDPCPVGTHCESGNGSYLCLCPSDFEDESCVIKGNYSISYHYSKP